MTKGNSILVEAWLHPAAMTVLEAASRVIRQIPAPDADESVRREITGVIASARWRVDGVLMDALPCLLVVGRTGIGVDNVDVGAATERGIAVVNTPDAPSLSTAEHSVSLILALAKRHKQGGRVLRGGGSLQNEPPGVELKGKVLGLVGLGRVGAAVARICSLGLGMTVLAFDPYLAPERAGALGVTHDPPATPETQRLIDANALSVMKPGAYLINCSRGSVVDEAALVDALQSGRLAGAGLDVFDPEPPSPANSLLQMENVVVTPHSASCTDDARRAMGLDAVEQVMAVLDGRRPQNLVNPDVWECDSRDRRLQAASA
jgi:D-3-phosphoglycerate dehydrogenase